MNQEKINFFKLKRRQEDKEAIKRLTSNNDSEITILTSKVKNRNMKIKFSELANDSLNEIKQDEAKRLALFNTEAFNIITNIKKIDRVLKYRKKPKLDD